MFHRGVSFGSLLLLCLLFVAALAGHYEFPEPIVKFYRNGGFEVSIAADSGISLCSFRGDKLIRGIGRDPTWNQIILESTDNRFTFIEPHAQFELRNRLSFKILVIHDGDVYNMIHEEEVKSLEPLPVHGIKSNAHQFPPPLIGITTASDYSLYLPVQDGIEMVKFTGYRLLRSSQSSVPDFRGVVEMPTNGAFVERRVINPLRRGQMWIYNIDLTFKGVPHHLGKFTYSFNGDETGDLLCYLDRVGSNQRTRARIPLSQLHELQNPQLDTRADTPTTTNPPPPPTGCVPSISVANGQPVACAGTEIFFDNFSGISLNYSQWTFERRLAGAPDYEFVVYTDHSLTTHPSKGLKIEPKFTTDVFGNDQLRKKLVLSECSGQLESMDCVFDPKVQRDLVHPIVTSQITTSGLFSFKYGRVEIIAKMPTGDWIIPQMWLQPQGSKYNKTDFQAGLINLGKIVNYPAGLKSVKQGVVLGAEEPLRSAYLSQKAATSQWAEDFHEYVMEWRTDGLSFSIDGMQSVIGDWTEIPSVIPGSGSWKNGKSGAPFDQEFYITIGVGVGGRNDFPYDTPWERTSPQMNREFYNSKFRWSPSWTKDTKTLLVKSIKVISL